MPVETPTLTTRFRSVKKDGPNGATIDGARTFQAPSSYNESRTLPQINLVWSDADADSLYVRAATEAQQAMEAAFVATRAQQPREPLYPRAYSRGMFTDPIMNPMIIDPLPPTMGEKLGGAAKKVAIKIFDKIMITRNRGRHVAR